MRKILTSRWRIGLAVAAFAAFSVPLLTPTPAAAWWYHHGYGWHRGWHAGWGWRRPGWGPGVVVAPPVVYAPPPFVAHRVWVPGYWRGGYWVAGGWR